MVNNFHIGRDIPEELRRAVLVEAGHRCAIPTCRQPTIEIAHIKPWKKIHEHTFNNLVALCPTCHDRYDKKHEIDRKAMLQYKANLAIINRQYRGVEVENERNSTEQESYIILDRFAFDPVGYDIWNKIF